MNNQPLVSILTTTKNNAHDIRATIDSITAQTMSDFEIIVKDKLSTDGTPDILASYGKAISYYESTSDTGIYDGLNIAATHATGIWCIVIQSGDLLYNESVLEQVAPLLKTTDAGIVYGPVVSFTDTHEEKVSPTYPVSRLPYSMIGSHQGMFIRTELLKKYPYNLTYRIAADYDFLWKCSQRDVIFQQINTKIAIVDRQGLSSIRLEENHREKEQIANKYSTAFAPKVYRFITRLRLRLQWRQRVKSILKKISRYFTH
jgi:glycosyltransferase involved in cell wall biosynthesis